MSTDSTGLDNNQITHILYAQSKQLTVHPLRTLDL
jgi:hypothetical protein